MAGGSLCGQAPSDRPEVAAFQAEIGLDSISVTPGAFAKVVTRLRREASHRSTAGAMLSVVVGYDFLGRTPTAK